MIDEFRAEVLCTGSTWGSVDPPDFTRDSPAYLDGVEYASNTPRFTSAGLLLEEGTTNIVLNPFLEGTYTDGLAPQWTKNGTPQVSENTDTRYIKYGSKSQHIVTSGPAQGIWQLWPQMNIQPSTIYSISAWVYVVYGAVEMRHENFLGGDYPVASAPGWNYLSVVRTSPASISGSLCFYSTGLAEFYVDSVQVEEKLAATSITYGTRSPESLALPIDGRISLDNCTLEMIITPQTFMDAEDSFFLALQYQDGENLETAYYLVPYAYQTPTKIIIRHSQGERSVWSNGVKVWEAANPYSATVQTITIGGFTEDDVVNIAVKNFHAHNRAFTDLEIKARSGTLSAHKLPSSVYYAPLESDLSATGTVVGQYPLDLLGLTIDECLDFGKPTTAKLTLDNFQGNMRQLCTVGNQVRIFRNDTQIYRGVINTPSASIGNKSFTLSLDTVDYYMDKLMRKQTGDAYIWDFVRVTPADLFRCFIGTRFIAQEFFANYRRIDESTMSNLCVQDQTLQLIKNGSTYQASGYLYSKTLQNSSDWDTMGDIKSVAVTIDGTSQLTLTNLLTNSGFESDLIGWDTVGDNYDVTHTDTTTSDFDAGIKTNVDTANDEVKLAKTGANLSYTETLTADFASGTLTNVTAANDALTLTDNTAGNQSHTDTTTSDFDAGTYYNTNASNTADQLQLNAYNSLGYKYRSQIPVNGSSDGTQNNYPLKLIVYKGTGTNSTGVLYLNNKALSWTGSVPNDLRFATGSDGSGLCDYWIESSDTSSAIIWIEVPSIPTGGTNIYAFFGKSGDTTTSSGANTFIMFDDFPGTSFDSKWTLTTGASCNNGIATINNGYLRTDANYSWGTAMRCRMTIAKDSSIRGGGYYNGIYFYGNSPSYVHGVSVYSGSTLHAYVNDNGLCLSAETYTSSTWAVFDIKRRPSGNTDFTINDSGLTTQGCGTSTSAGVGFRNSASDNNVQVDWVLVRKVTTNEPSLGTPYPEVAQYASSGTWISPADSFTINSTILSSSISWNEILNGGTITVQTKVGSNSWQTVTNGGSIPDLTDNMGNTTIQVKVTLTAGNGNTTTPILLDITKAVNLTHNYSTSGTRIKTINLDNVGVAGANSISWNATTPANTTLTIQASLDGTNYSTCTNGQPIPGITAGYNCTGKTLYIKETLTTTDTTITPTLSDLTLSLSTAYYTTGNIVLPDLNVNAVALASNSTISWTETKPSNTTLTVQTSFDGTDWYTCTNGGAIPNVNGQDMTGKVIKTKVTFSTTDLLTTPILSNITLTVTSKNTEYVEVSTTNQKSGSKCLHLKCDNYTSGTEYGVISSGYQTLTAGQKARVVLDTKGTASTVYLRIKAYDSSNNYLNQQVLTLTNLNNQGYTSYLLDYVLPANTAKTKYEVKVTGTSDLYIDDSAMYLAVDEVKLEVSRDDGTTYNDTLVYYNGSQWTGNYVFSGSETVKNKLKYKITLYAQDSNTKSPLITQIRLDAVTESDTGVTEGTIDEWSNPVVADDTITQSFPNMSRHQAIANLVKITGQDAYIDGEGRAHLLNHRGTATHSWSTSTNLTGVQYNRLRDVMANKLTLIGNGTINTNIGLNVRWSMKDDESIALYGPIEKTVQERNITDLGTAGARCYTLLQQLKVPGEKISASLIDPLSIDWAVGDNVNITDETNSTGINPLTPYRITRATRKYDTSGEAVSVELGSAKTELEDVIGATVDLINNYIGVEQANAMPTPASAWTDVDKDQPAECLVWIDPTREVKRIILNVFSRKFRATSKSVTAEAGGATTSSGGTSHTHSVSWGNHAHSIEHQHTIPRTGDFSIFDHTHAHGDPVTGEAEFGTITIYGYGLTSASGGGGSATSGSDTSHTHTIGDHTHTTSLVFGIYEFSYYAPVTMHVNSPSQAAYSQFGTQGSESNSFSVTGLDITSLYSQSGGTGKLGPGANFIYFKTQATTNNPSGLLRLYTDIRVIYK